MTYPLIERCGLRVRTVELRGHPSSDQGSLYREIVLASDLEKMLSEGVEVVGRHGFDTSSDSIDHAWTTITSSERCTHTGILINIQPIKKLEPVSRDELLEFFNIMAHRFDTLEYANQVNKLKERVEKAGVK